MFMSRAIPFYLNVWKKFLCKGECNVVREQTLEKIGKSQFKEIYFLMMDIEHTGTSYLKAIDTITTINSTTIPELIKRIKELEKKVADLSGV